MKEVIFKLPDEVLTLIVHKVANTPQEASLLEKWIYDGEERKTGKWVKDEYGTDRCSCCDYIPAYDIAIDDIYYSPYCPNCGAKMEADE